jgi:hypothetical protein
MASTIVRASFDVKPASSVMKSLGSNTNQRSLLKMGLEQRDTGRLIKRLTTVSSAIHVTKAV